MSYEFHPEAEQELYEAASRYESEVPQLGLRFADEVERVVQLLLELLPPKFRPDRNTGARDCWQRHAVTPGHRCNGADHSR